MPLFSGGLSVAVNDNFQELTLGEIYEKNRARWLAEEKEKMEQQKNKALAEQELEIFNIAKTIYPLYEAAYFDQILPPKWKQTAIWPHLWEIEHQDMRTARWEHCMNRARLKISTHNIDWNANDDVDLNKYVDEGKDQLSMLDPASAAPASADPASATPLLKRRGGVTGKAVKKQTAGKQRKSTKQRRRKSTKQRRSMKHRK